MFKEIFKNSESIKEDGFEYYDIQNDYNVSINFIQQDTKVPPHSHDLEVFNYVFNGELSIVINGVAQSYMTGDWIHIPAGRVHSLETKSEVTLLELWKK